jgi:hypothetical protein
MAKMSNFQLRDQNVSDMSDMSTFFGFDNPRSKRVLDRISELDGGTDLHMEDITVFSISQLCPIRGSTAVLASSNLHIPATLKQYTYVGGNGYVNPLKKKKGFQLSAKDFLHVIWKLVEVCEWQSNSRSNPNISLPRTPRRKPCVDMSAASSETTSPPKATSSRNAVTTRPSSSQLSNHRITTSSKCSNDDSHQQRYLCANR